MSRYFTECPGPTVIAYADVTISLRLIGSRVTYGCEDGSIPVNEPSAITCALPGLWTNTNFFCQPGIEYKYEVHCERAQICVCFCVFSFVYLRMCATVCAPVCAGVSVVA
jgi:hypothetical protein